jgi:WD40 repeat protein
MFQSFNFRWGLTGACLVAMLVGCGGSPLSATPTPAGAGLQAPADQPPGRSRLDSTNSGQDLLYVNDGDEYVYVYTYPQGHLIDTLTGFIFPLGECVDSAGDVFVVTQGNKYDNSGIIYEYAHGGTSPIVTLSDPNPAFGCGVDPQSGNLAVAGRGVAIYKHASGEPVIYGGSEGFYFCGYDRKGNLYASTTNGRYGDQEQLVRLAKGSSTFEQITLSVTLYANGNFPSSVQWDGKYMTVSSTSEGIVGGHDGPVYLYRLRISGDNATVVGTTTLSSRKNNFKSGQTWIQDNHVLGADFFRGRGGVDLWSYPNAGEPRGIIPDKTNLAPFGIAVSPAVSP